MSLCALGAQRLRTALCIAGTAVGIAGVLVLAAIGEGARRRVLAQIDGMGRNMLVVTPPAVNARSRVIRDDPALRPPLLASDAPALLASAPSVARVAPANDRTVDAHYGRIRTRVTALATTTAWLPIRGFTLTEGRFFTEAEDEAMARVAVLGAQVRWALFPDSVRPLGKTILVGGVPFVVIGVLEAKGLSASGTVTEDDKVLLPFQTGRRRLFGSDYVKALYVQVADWGADGRAEAEIADVLRARRALDGRSGPDLRIDGQRVLLEARLGAQAPLRRMLLTLGAFSLAVAAVGVMAAMLLSVRERRQEIGLRVAVGARRRDLASQFFVEALALSAAGGALGLLLGGTASAVIAGFTRWDLALSGATLSVAAGGTVAIGVLSGLVPALRASRLDPIAALRAS